MVTKTPLTWGEGVMIEVVAYSLALDVALP